MYEAVHLSIHLTGNLQSASNLQIDSKAGQQVSLLPDFFWGDRDERGSVSSLVKGIWPPPLSQLQSLSSIFLLTVFFVCTRARVVVLAAQFGCILK